MAYPTSPPPLGYTRPQPARPAGFPLPAFNVTQTAGGSPGFTPDYKTLIGADPLYSQQASNLSAQGVEDATARQAAIRRALIGFGAIPSDLPPGLTGEIGADTSAAAQQLTDAGLSTTANLSRQHEAALNDLMAQQAARGAVQSGGTGVGLRNIEQDYSQQQFDARQHLLDLLSGLQSTFAQSERDRQGQLAQGAQAATDRVMKLYPAVPAVPGRVVRSLNVPRLSSAYLINPNLAHGGTL